MKRPLMPDGSAYPVTIKVKNVPYFVTFVKRLPDGDLGQCDDEAKVIYIAMNQDKHEMRRTFKHEWGHAIVKEYKIKLSHDDIRKMEWAITELFDQLG